MVGYARCSTVMQDLTAQREILAGLGVPEDRIYLGKGLTGTSRPALASTMSSRPCAAGTPWWSPSSTGSPARSPTPVTSVTPCHMSAHAG